MEKQTEKKTQEEVIINGIPYAPKNQLAKDVLGQPYVICRTYSAGVFAGYLEKREGKEVTLKNARRCWMWTGAASLSQLAMSGTSNPKGCKFPETVERVLLTECIELLDCTEAARKSIAEVPVWKN